MIAVEIECNEDNLCLLSEFLIEVDNCFPTPLSKKTNSHEYAHKILKFGNVFIVKNEKKIVGAIMGYGNDIESKRGIITVFAVLPEYRKMGLGNSLLEAIMKRFKSNGMNCVDVFTNNVNQAAIKLYLNYGFIKCSEELIGDDYHLMMSL